jgi:hypothetical protein
MDDVAYFILPQDAKCTYRYVDRYVNTVVKHKPLELKRFLPNPNRDNWRPTVYVMGGVRMT